MNHSQAFHRTQAVASACPRIKCNDCPSGLVAGHTAILLHQHLRMAESLQTAKKKSISCITNKFLPDSLTNSMTKIPPSPTYKKVCMCVTRQSLNRQLRKEDTTPDHYNKNGLTVTTIAVLSRIKAFVRVLQSQLSCCLKTRTSRKFQSKQFDIISSDTVKLLISGSTPCGDTGDSAVPSISKHVF